jgi:hypothetical protein
MKVSKNTFVDGLREVEPGNAECREIWDSGNSRDDANG